MRRNDLLRHLEQQREYADAMSASAPVADVLRTVIDQLQLLEDADVEDNGQSADRLIPVVHAAERLGLSRSFLYAHADDLPFVVRLPTGGLRIHEGKLNRWVERL